MPEMSMCSYAVSTAGQKGECLSSTGRPGRRGAGLASSTRGLVMWIGAQTSEWSDHRVGIVTGLPAAQMPRGV